MSTGLKGSRKSWQITLNVPACDAIPQLPLQACPDEAVVCAGQLESAPTTGQLHWHIYYAFQEKKTFEKVKCYCLENFGLLGNTAHIERCRGGRNANLRYVTKSDTAVEPERYRFIFGATVSLRRSDLPNFFRSGGSINQLCADPAWDSVVPLLSKSRLIELREMYAPVKRNPLEQVNVELHIGPSGYGKTRRVFSAVPEIYPKPSGKWWSLYNYERSVILDDFDGCCLSFGDFKRVLDRYPTIVEIKGGAQSLLANHFVITTNYYPSHWWSLKTTGTVGRDAIWRRITRVFEYTEPMQLPTEYDPVAYRSMNWNLEKEDPKGERST